MNLVLLFLYFVVTVTSLLTVLQSFNLSAILTFVLNLILFIYMFHVFLRNTRFWKEFKLCKSPFNELGNDWLFAAVIVLSVTKLAVVLIFTTSLDGAFLSFLDCFFICLFGRYIYLYRYYLDKKNIDANNSGDFTEIKEKVNDFVEENDLDGAVESLKNIGDNINNGVTQILDKTEIDEKIVEAIKVEEPPAKKKKGSTKKKSTKKKVVK